MVLVSAASIGVVVSGQQTPAPAPAGGQPGAAPQVVISNTPRADANGNPLRTATTGHVSNYDEAKVAPYTLPDPLVLATASRVQRRRAPGNGQRRPEIMRLYETEIFGRVPANAPKVTWEVTTTDPAARDGTVADERGRGIGGQRRERRAHPADALYAGEGEPARVPIILLVNFGGGATPARGRGGASSASRRSRPTSWRAAGATRRSATRTSSPIARTP